MAQAVRRLGGEVALVEAASHVLGREPEPLGQALGDVTGIHLLTHVGKYQGEVVASNILGEPRDANYEAIP